MPMRLFLFLLLLLLPVCFSFIVTLPGTLDGTLHGSTGLTRLNLFDFFKEKSKEGVIQLGNIAKGDFVSVGNYISQENEILSSRLSTIFSQTQMGADLMRVFTGEGGTEEMLHGLRDVLLKADMGTEASDEVIEEVRAVAKAAEGKVKPEKLTALVRSRLISILTSPSPFASLAFSTSPDTPTVHLVMGSNGMGKTTTIGKLSRRLTSGPRDSKVLLAACDTYRAGATSQLAVWAERAGVEVYAAEDVARANCAPGEGPEEEAVRKVGPSTVLFKALEKAKRENFDVVIVDTSGRLSNNQQLNKELIKIKSVVPKVLSGTSAHETLLVVDASQGAQAVESARRWSADVGVTSLALTKLDGTAKGGAVVAI
eukprot:CAMPEP_0182457180 /NCGR_PEP_ID=MMETSP1319-20130603/2812_1 /TAXON_ID=172717 /ORGANISM="Bolidomonas pacifica, Strain RCC208" /LENGTH=369 /DNA_ID=CAMNT_0024655593 /DNA_START=147 /DNA_END=1253 /DNA_ORIENTATION=-